MLESSIELFINAIYDSKGDSGWEEASLEERINTSYEEVIDNAEYSLGQKSVRFKSKNRIVNDLRKAVIKRLAELKEEGYKIKAVENIGIQNEKKSDLQIITEYEKVRKSRKYNMITEAHKACAEADLTPDEYMYAIENYNRLIKPINRN